MLELDVPRARAARLLSATATEGIFGNKEMPKDLAPPGVDAGSEEHMSIVSLTVAIDYIPNADQLRDASRNSYVHSHTRYPFDPGAVARTGPRRVIGDMQRMVSPGSPSRTRACGRSTPPPWTGTSRVGLRC